jgi:hypothetical protein
MEDKKMEGGTCGSGCGASCGEHGHCMHKKHFIKKILMLVVIMIVFSLGIQIGELKGELRSLQDSHRSMMGNYSYDNYVPRMMIQGQGTWSAPTTAAPTVTLPAKQ